jgi:hypothetical protein
VNDVKPEPRDAERPAHPLPPELRAQLLGFEQKLRRAETWAAIAGAIVGAALSYLFVFAFDRLGDTPAILRLLLMLVAAGAWAGAVYWWLRHWFFRRRDHRDLARLIQRHIPRLGDRLLGAVELAEGEDERLNASPALLRAALAQVAGEAKKFDFTVAVPRRRSRRLSLAVGLLLTCAALTAVLAPFAAHNALLRWLKPLAQVERFTFVSLEALPDFLVTPHGEPFEIACGLSGASRWKPPEIVARIADQPEVRATFSGGQALLRFPGQTAENRLALRAGDFRKSMVIQPKLRPELLRMAARVQWPAYLGRPGEEFTVGSGRFPLLAGASATFAGQTSRELTQAAFTNGTAQKLSVSSNRFETAPVVLVPKPVAEVATNCSLVFEWSDIYRLRCAAPYRLELVGRSDETPVVTGEGLAESVAILPDESLEWKVAARDDFGLKRVWLAYWIEAATAEEAATNAPIVQTRSLVEGEQSLAATNAIARIAPIAWQLPEGVTVCMQACALDYFPDRVAATSAVVRIHILSRAEHARLIQEQARRLLARLEDVAREEERLLANSTEISQRPESEMKSDKTAGDLRENENGERANAQTLEKLAQALEKLTQEALRNRDIKQDALAKWLEQAAKMQQTASQPMSQAAQSLAKAQNNADNRKQQSEQAAKNEAEALAQLRDLQQAAQATIDQMTARNFVNRLREAAKQQGQIGEGLQEELPRTAGLSADRLPSDSKLKLRKMEEKQTNNRNETEFVRDDLAGFFQRTQQPVYDEVRKDMTAPDVVEQMQALGNDIAKNVGGQAIGKSQAVQKRLTEWADKLEEAANSGGGGGGGGGGGPQVEKEVILGLMRARIREESLREQTRAVDQIKQEKAAHTLASGSLASMQQQISEDTKALKEKTQIAQAAQAIEKLGNEMDNAGLMLRKPQTDGETIAVETGIIEAIAAMMQANKSSSQAQGDMAALQAMMQQMGQKPGGNTSGGDPDHDTQKFGGPGAGQGDAARRVRQSGGADAANLPLEYRDLMQDYFRAADDALKTTTPGGKKP